MFQTWFLLCGFCCNMFTFEICFPKKRPAAQLSGAALRHGGLRLRAPPRRNDRLLEPGGAGPGLGGLDALGGSLGGRSWSKNVSFVIRVLCLIRCWCHFFGSSIFGGSLEWCSCDGLHRLIWQLNGDKSVLFPRDTKVETVETSKSWPIKRRCVLHCTMSWLPFIEKMFSRTRSIPESPILQEMSKHLTPRTLLRQAASNRRKTTILVDFWWESPLNPRPNELQNTLYMVEQNRFLVFGCDDCLNRVQFQRELRVNPRKKLLGFVVASCQP